VRVDKGFRSSQGFTLMELLIAVTIMLIVIGPLLEAASRYMQRYRGQQLIVEMNQGLRAAQELIGQEVIQAGFHSFAPRRVTIGVFAAPGAQAAQVNDTSFFYVGQKLAIDLGINQEIVQITDVAEASVTGVFRKDHAAGAVITEVGPFATGILPGSTANVMQIYGDIDGDGTLVFVEYRHDPVTRRLTRAVTPVGAVAQNAADVVLDNVLPNPGGNPIFRYRPLNRAGATFVVEVVVTLTVQTAERDPVTGAFRTQTASVALTPRNVLAAYDLAGLTGTRDVQNEPPGLPIP